MQRMVLTHTECNAATTADGFGLGDLKSFIKQSLKASIRQLHQILAKQQPEALDVLLNSPDTFWEQLRTCFQQEQHAVVKMRIIQHGFEHAVWHQLEIVCWSSSAPASDAFCFSQRKQVCQSHCNGQGLIE